MRQFSQKIIGNLMVVASIFSTSSTGYAQQPQASQVYGMPTEAPLVQGTQFRRSRSPA